MITRRSLIKSLISFVAAPAVMRVAPIMSVKSMPIIEYDIARDAYTEISIGYQITRKTIDDALYKTQFRPANLGIIEALARSKHVTALELMRSLDTRLE